VKQSTRELLEAAAAYGKRNSGYGFSTARLIREALENEAIPEVVSANDLSEAFDMAHGLIQEAKGAGNGFVVDYLDAAENWLDKAEAITTLLPYDPEVGLRVKAEAGLRSIMIDDRGPGNKDDFTRGCEYAYRELLKG
jgi:hypothetical protein